MTDDTLKKAHGLIDVYLRKSKKENNPIFGLITLLLADIIAKSLESIGGMAIEEATPELASLKIYESIALVNAGLHKNLESVNCLGVH